MAGRGRRRRRRHGPARRRRFAALRPNGRRVGLILGLAGVAWLAGTLDASLAALHRGPLVHALSHSRTAASGQPWRLAQRRPPTRAAPSRPRQRGVAHPRGRGGNGRSCRRGTAAPPVGPPRLIVEPVAFGTALALAAAASLRDDDGLADIAQWLYYAVVTVASIAVAVRLARSTWTGAALGGLVAELGELEGADALRDRLARAMAIPTWWSATGWAATASMSTPRARRSSSRLRPRTDHDRGQ